ncbi:MAG: TerB family tellurite resistance protein [Cyanobacteria bacterium REEB67]|nr:TerB family tellurite resistance protein [Cyanobacteria bacterium REEB67]
MSFWEKVKDAASSLSADLKGRASRYNNANFKNATMAICALVATADGSIQPEEKRKVAACIGSTDALAAFDSKELKGQFDKYCEEINTDVDFGRVNLLRVVAKLKGRADETDAAIQIALIIANADGVFQDCEKEQVRDICRTLGVDSKPYVN